MIPILILAAGASSRMRGADKLAEHIGRTPLLRLQAQRALATGQPVFIAVPSPDHPRVALISDLPVTILSVPEAAEGMSGSLRGAVKHLPTCEKFMLLLADLPEIEADDLTAVMTAQGHPDTLIWRGSTEDGKPGHPVMFHASLRPLFAALTGDTGGEPIVKAHKDRTVFVPLHGTAARRDLDTPEDWAAFRAETNL